MHLLHGFSCCLSAVPAAIHLFCSWAQNISEGELSWKKSTPWRTQNSCNRQQHLTHQWNQSMCPKPNLLQVEEVEPKSLKSVLCCYNFETSFIYFKIFLNSTVLVHEDPVVTLKCFLLKEWFLHPRKVSHMCWTMKEVAMHPSLWLEEQRKLWMHILEV